MADVNSSNNNNKIALLSAVINEFSDDLDVSVYNEYVEKQTDDKIMLASVIAACRQKATTTSRDLGLGDQH